MQYKETLYTKIMTNIDQFNRNKLNELVGQGFMAFERMLMFCFF